MKKIRQYKFDTIEICRNCGGKGVVAIEKKGLFPSLRGTGVTECDVCDGTGRVTVTKDVTITVESYTEGSKPGY